MLEQVIVPQISVIMGPCAGGAVYSPAITDFVIMVDKTAHMFITGPEVIKTVTNEEVSFEDLGGANTHGSKSGVSHFTAEDDQGAIDLARELVDLLPQITWKNHLRRKLVTLQTSLRKLNSIVPEDPTKPYDVKDVITEILDDGGFLEVQENWAGNIVVGFGHLNGNGWCCG